MGLSQRLFHISLRSSDNMVHILRCRIHLQQLLHIILVLKQSGTAYSCHGSSSTAFSHISCLKMVRDKPQCVWFSAHCLIAHLLSFKTAGNIKRYFRVGGHCLIARLLHRKTVRDLFYPAYNGHILFDLFRPSDVKICPKVVIFVSDNFKSNYLLLPPSLFVF